MKLTQNNGERFTDWEMDRPAKSRLKSMIKQLITISCKYDDTGLPPVWATSNEFSYRVHLLFWDNPKKKYIAETAHLMCNRGDLLRHKKLFPEVTDMRGVFNKPLIEDFERAMHQLKKYLMEEYAAEKAKGVKED